MRLIIVVIIALSAPAVAGPTGDFFGQHREGWFFYELEPIPQPEPEQSQASPPSPPAPPVAAPAEPPAPAGSAPLSAAWFRANLDRYRDAAIDSPTPANVAAYYYLQRVALDKANRFAEVAQQVVLTDPHLDEGARRPLASFAAAEVSAQASEARTAVVRSLAQQAGIWFFFRSDCPYCHLQAPVLKLLEQQYGFVVYPISVDGAPLPDSPFPEFARDTGQSQALQVTTVPALYLVRPPQDVLPVGQGVLSLDQLVQRMLMAAAQAGWISPADYEQTRPVRMDLLFQADNAVPKADALQSPGQLLEYLRSRGVAPPVIPGGG